LGGMLARRFGIAVASTRAMSSHIAAARLKSGELGSFRLWGKRKGCIATWNDNLFLISRRFVMGRIITLAAFCHCYFFLINNDCLRFCSSFLIYSQSDFCSDLWQWSL
jgi:hypothetical protein